MGREVNSLELVHMGTQVHALEWGSEIISDSERVNFETVRNRRKGCARGEEVCAEKLRLAVV